MRLITGQTSEREFSILQNMQSNVSEQQLFPYLIFLPQICFKGLYKV